MPNFRSKKIEERNDIKTLLLLALARRKKKVSCHKQIQSFYTPENPRAVARFFSQEDFFIRLKATQCLHRESPMLKQA